MTQLVDDYVFLVGRPPILEFVGFIKTLASDGSSLDDGVLIQEWRNANDRVRELEDVEAGLADGHTVQGIPLEMEAIIATAMADPMVQKVYGLLPFHWGIVELDRLVGFARWLRQQPL